MLPLTYREYSTLTFNIKIKKLQQNAFKITICYSNKSEGNAYYMLGPELSKIAVTLPTLSWYSCGKMVGKQVKECIIPNSHKQNE